jgi:hypothetical protein
MSEEFEAVVERAMALSDAERAKLVASLQSTLDHVDPAWEAAWSEECERRIAAIDRGEMGLIDAASVMARARERASRA